MALTTALKESIITWSSVLDVEFYRLYNGRPNLGRDLTSCLCRDFAVIFAIFTKVFPCFLKHFFCRDFLLSLTFSLGLSVPTLRRFCRLRSMM